MRLATPRFAGGLSSQALMLLLAACGGGDGGSMPGPSPPPPAPADTTAPTVPQGLTATAQSATTIALTWSASMDPGSGVAGYRVFRNAGATAIATVTTTNYTDTTLAAATQYTYTVRAFDGASPANESAASAAASATTNGSPPPPTGPPAGLDARPSNTSCLAGDAPPVSLGLQRVFPNLPNFTLPIAMLQAPGDSSRWYVVQKNGVVRSFQNLANVATSSEFINITSRLNYDTTGNSPNDERGLLGMAFHPNYPTDPRVYLYYTGSDPSLGLVDRVSEFRTLDGGQTLSPGSELVLFNVDDPETNHNGGNIAFGPDGFLYIGIGDGGGAGDAHDPIGNGQRLTILLGKMLRIDIAQSSMAQTYRIPSSNPYAANARCNANGTGSANCPEIYAYGLRNPWRWSFDRQSGELWLNDVGQGALEEVDRITLGGNYGWRCFEGTNTYPGNCGPNASSAIAPIAQYGRTLGQSTTGGFVYRGTAIPNLVGRYVFADFATGNLWNIARDTPPTLTLANDSAQSTGLQISSFAQDTTGELYVVHFGGTLHKIVPGTGGGSTIPTLLSDTGCVNPANPAQPASGLIPYAPNAPFYSDGAAKSRWLALPDGQRIVVGTDGDFDFPSGSVLMKNFSLGGQLVETRLFKRHNDGSWAGYTYEWNDQHTDATRVIGGKSKQVGSVTWDFPSETQCLQCHTLAAGRTLGLELGQLNGDLAYPSPGRSANQLVTLNAIDTLTPALTQTPAQLPAIPDPQGGAALDGRARAYLHTNCSNCHRPQGNTPSDMDLRFTASLAGTHACDVTPTLGDLGIGNPRLIAPGSAARSVIVARVNRTGTDAMPPLARHTIDTAGVQLLTDWINGLTSCN
jgi:uncharacterized repeat protein (TIGR03806 family)